MLVSTPVRLHCRGGRGRHAFVFARYPNNAGMIAFHVFQAIPFLYELRELLDWYIFLALQGSPPCLLIRTCPRRFLRASLEPRQYRFGSQHQQDLLSQQVSAFVLDWDLTLVSRSCTSTTLSLFDWLKLEDISISLFFVTVSRRNKKRHRLGQRQPRYMKFFQVGCTSCSAPSLLKSCSI